MRVIQHIARTASRHQPSRNSTARFTHHGAPGRVTTRRTLLGGAVWRVVTRARKNLFQCEEFFDGTHPRLEHFLSGTTTHYRPGRDTMPPLWERDIVSTPIQE